LLDPDQTMLDKATEANARLRGNYPDGYALDVDHAPHITVLQRFVRTADLEKIFAAVASVIRSTQPKPQEMTVTGYYYIPYKNLGLAGITVEPTQELLDFQKKLIAAVQPFTVDNGTGAAFVQRSDGVAISQPTVDYVNAYVPKYSGNNFNPHVTSVWVTGPSLKRWWAIRLHSFASRKSRSASTNSVTLAPPKRSSGRRLRAISGRGQGSLHAQLTRECRRPPAAVPDSSR
jgi:hypothetical protein